MSCNTNSIKNIQLYYSYALGSWQVYFYSALQSFTIAAHSEYSESFSEYKQCQYVIIVVNIPILCIQCNSYTVCQESYVHYLTWSCSLFVYSWCKRKMWLKISRNVTSEIKSRLSKRPIKAYAMAKKNAVSMIGKVYLDIFLLQQLLKINGSS